VRAASKPGRTFKRKTIGGGKPGASRQKPADAKAAGLAARILAVDLIAAVTTKRQPLDDALAKAFAKKSATVMEPRDRAHARLIAATTLRYAPALQAVIDRFMEKPLQRRNWRVPLILLSATAQLLILKTPAHAAISLAVDQTRLTPQDVRLDKLVNAVLRRVAADGLALLAECDLAKTSVPDWLYAGWEQSYGEDTARPIALACLNEAALDLTVKNDPPGWAERLGGIALATGSVRTASGGRVEDMVGYRGGMWWVQDAAAALPARLLGKVKGQRVADLCAAPGGKTAQLAAAGAHVTAVDISPHRLERVRENLDRLSLKADLVAADVLTWVPDREGQRGGYDAILLDAPCSATGTIRRHPDILHLKQPGDIERLVPLQAALLDAAFRLLRPGGVLVYCTCSLEPAEGEDQLAGFLARQPEALLDLIKEGEASVISNWLTSKGTLRTLPSHTPPRADGQGETGLTPGMDGFFAARIRRRM